MFADYFDLGTADVGGRRAIDTGEVRLGEPIGVDQRELPNTETDELLGHNGTSASTPDDCHVKLVECRAASWRPTGAEVDDFLGFQAEVV